MNVTKQDAIQRVLVVATLEAAAAKLKYPGVIGEAMAYTIRACAAQHAHYIAAHSPSDGAGIVVGPNVATG